MEVNPTARERCSDVHHALTQYIGQAAVHMAISAVKMVFPNIPRKTFDRIAFYVGIRFKDPSLGHTPLQSAATTLNSLSDIKTEYSDSAANKLVVAWYIFLFIFSFLSIPYRLIKLEKFEVKIWGT